MNYDWAFLPMVASNGLLDDPAALRRRLDEDGYLYFSRLLDRAKIMRVRRSMLATLRDCGWVDPEPLLMRGRVAARPVREGSPEFFEAYDEIQRLEEFHMLAHDEALVATMRAVLGDSAFPHPLKIARLIFPSHYEVSTPPHQDYPNNQGTPGLTATWIPVGDLPSIMGGLAILRGSHRWGVLPVTTHLGAGNRAAVLPQALLEDCRWVTTEFEAGDVLVFPSQTVHAARHNASEFYLRLSVDFRYQLEGEALTAGCLEPHFGRLTWDDIYAEWSSSRHQYYWHDLDFGGFSF
jgi:ectoine hydroxylase-related dioxygenase (phytanoyl-CoA dioxygenase family)